MYYETTVKSINPDGKKISEQFIMKADCFTDAETQTIEQFGENEIFEITAIKKSKIKGVITEGIKFFRAVAEFASIDEESGREKKVKEQYLFGANDVNSAKDRIDEWLIGSAVPTEIKSIVETKLKLDGAKVINGKGDIPHVVIPIDQTKLNVYKRNEGGQSIYLNLHMMAREDDKYGNDFMISRATTKEESEHNKTASKEDKQYGPILGNAKFFESQQQDQEPETDPISDVFDTTTDVPF